jgi:hypothetical protein
MAFKLSTGVAFDAFGMAVSSKVIRTTTFVASLQSSFFLAVDESSTHARAAESAPGGASAEASTSRVDVHFMLG